MTVLHREHPCRSCASAGECALVAHTGEDGAVAEGEERIPVTVGVSAPEKAKLGAASVELWVFLCHGRSRYGRAHQRLHRAPGRRREPA